MAAAPASADAQDDPARQPPFGGQHPPELVPAAGPDDRPPGFTVDAEEAGRLALATEAAREQLADAPPKDLRIFVRGERWQVDLSEPGGEAVARIVLDGETGELVEELRDEQLGSELARGYEGAVAQKVNAPYVWLPLCVLFLLPFVDWRRPLRLLHLDLLVVLGLGASLYFFNRAEIEVSVALYYPFLGYLLIRMLVAGLFPRVRSGPLIPHVSVTALAIAAVLLAAGRIALNVTDSQVIDVGVAGVIGADRLVDGEELYAGGFSEGIDLRGDVYGPANYLAYVPAEQLWPWEGVWDDVPAAHVAAIGFDLLCALGLFALGRRLRDGAEGKGLGLALAFAWLACPFTLYAMNANANDSLVAALGIGALLTLGSPTARGALTALAAAAKFGSAALAPLFATGTGERRWRSAAIFTLAFAAVAAGLVLPLLPDGGLRDFYDRTLGYQATRGSPFSVWGQAPSLDFLQPVARVAAVTLALGLALWPRFRSPIQVAALAAAATIAIQLTATHWFYFYVVWFLPFVLVAAFASQARMLPAASSRSGSRADRAAAS